MLRIRSCFLVLAAISAASAAVATDAVIGEAVTFQSPNGITEQCIRIAPMPGAVYSEKDQEAERAYCEIDLYAPTVAICPKTWSTSPGMMVYDISEGPFAGDRAGFEREACPEGKEAKSLAKTDLAKFKPTMNGKGTSGTYSPSPLLYYHFSRYFEADIEVPPAVWRSMDRQTHLSEVARPGLAIAGHSHSSRMNFNGWKILVDADADPDAYKPVSDLYTSDRAQLYGVLLDSPGSRYSSEVNGTRESGWGKGQNLDFQETAPFLALRSQKPLAEAVVEGVAGAIKDPQIKRDMGSDVAPEQIVFWMTDIANIVLLDFIFSQQDRIGNIDYKTAWYWNEGGELKHKKSDAKGKEDTPPVEGAIRIKRTHLNDNDAGARIEYANFTKSTMMLEKLRHFPAATYRKLMALNSDFADQGELYAYVRDSFGLDERQVEQVVKNTALAAGILSDTCARGEMLFDLEPEQFFLTGIVPAQAVDCLQP